MDIWRHGKYLDMWSLVHFLSGFVLCGLFYWLESGFIWIIEPSVNVIVDIVVGLLGFFSAAWLYFLRTEFDVPFYLTVVGVTFILSLWGFVDFLRKGYR